MRGKLFKVGDFNVYAAVPTQGDTSRGLLLIHEWWGLSDHMKRLAEGFAAMGYSVAAIDLFDGKNTTDPEVAAQYMKADKPAISIPRLGKALDWMCSAEGLGTSRIVSLGWCFGGGYSLQCALQHGDKVNGSVIYYGNLETDPEKLKGCRVPLLGIFADQDDWIDPPMVKGFEEACKKAGVSLESHVFHGGHAFANPAHKNFNPILAKQASDKVAPFLRRVLG